MIFTPSIDEAKVSKNGDSLEVTYPDAAGGTGRIDADMVILASAVVPDPGLEEMAGIGGFQLDGDGFALITEDGTGSMETSRPGIFVAGTVCGSRDIQGSVIQAESAAGQVIAFLSEDADSEMNASQEASG
jgi:heterodisulfide reductase subunit A